MRRLIIGLGVLLVASGQASAALIVIDFEVLEQIDAEIHNQGKFYSEDGFTLEADHPIPGNLEIFRTVGTLDTLFPGSTALFHGNSLGEIILTRDGGVPFDLFSIDLAELPPGRSEPGGPTDSGPFDVEFFGTQVGGGMVSTTFTVDSFLTLKTFIFPGFTNLVAVIWFQGPGGSGPAHQFDNIVASPVPEPSTLVLWSLGAVALGGLGWRRRKQAA